MPTRVTEAAVKAALLEQVSAEVGDAAGSNTLVSLKEQEKLSPEMQRAAYFARKAKGKGARITVADVVDSYETYVSRVFGAVNTRGKKWLSQKETRAIYDESLEGRVWEVRAKLLNPTGSSSNDLQAKVAAFIVDNVEPIAGEETGKIFPALDSGNSGLVAKLVSGAAAQRLADFADTWQRDGQPGFAYDPDTQKMLAVRNSGREDIFYLAAVDQQTGAVGAVEQIEISSLRWRLTQAEFEQVVGPIADFGASDGDYRHVDRTAVADYLVAGGEDLDIGNPYVDFPADQAAAIQATAESVLAEYGLPNVTLELNPAVIDRQSKLPGNTVDFEAALRASLDSFLSDFDDVESPLGIVLNDLPGSWPPSAETIAIAKAQVIDHANRPTSKLRVLNLDDRPEGGESTRDNWIVSLYMDSLSDHSHWALVDRAGEKPTFNYGFN